MINALLHQSGVLIAFPQRSKILRIAEVRVVLSPATMCAHCKRAVRVLCHRLERHAAAIILKMHKNTCHKKRQSRSSVVDVVMTLWERRVNAVWTLFFFCTLLLTILIFRCDPTVR